MTDRPSGHICWKHWGKIHQKNCNKMKFFLTQFEILTFFGRTFPWKILIFSQVLTFLGLMPRKWVFGVDEGKSLDGKVGNGCEELVNKEWMPFQETMAFWVGWMQNEHLLNGLPLVWPLNSSWVHNYFLASKQYHIFLGFWKWKMQKLF